MQLRNGLVSTIIYVICLVSISVPLLANTTSSSLLPLIAFRINNGNPFTNQTEVSVEIRSAKLTDSLIAEMKIGITPTLSDVPWIKFSNEKQKVILPQNEGINYIYAQLKDIAGNISPVEAGQIILDTQEPQLISLAINRNEKYSRDEQRRIVVFIETEEKDLAEMIFSNRSDFNDAAWEPIANVKRWILDQSGGDGEKIVYAKFKDKAGNISQIFSDSIILDTQPPQNGSIVINEDKRYTQDPHVILHIKADGASVVRILSPGKSEVLDYQVKEGFDYMEVDWELDSIEGTKVVRVYFMDEAKNRTTAVIQDEIIFDKTGPIPPFVSINGDARYTNDKNGLVTLRFTTRENPNNLTMMVSNYMDFHDATPQAFRNQINGWPLLAEEDGMKTVYSKYIDEAGNHSEISQSKIILDRIPPEVVSVKINEGGKWTTSIKVQVNMEVTDGVTMQLNNSPAISGMVIWEPFTPNKIDWSLLPGDGPKSVYARFKDAANNISDIVETKVILDTQPPKGDIFVNEGSKFTNNKEKSVKISLRSEDARGMQITNKLDFNQVKLQPFDTVVNDWILDGEDGMKTVFVRLRDEAGNFSNVITASIVLDREPPTETGLNINEGQSWVRNPSRRTSVELIAKGASHFMLSETAEFNDAEWVIYKNVTAWTFSEGEGEKELFAKYKDPAGNVSEFVSGKIKLDYTPPVCDEFSIDEGADFTNNSQKRVILSIKSTDAVKMAISNNPISDPTDASTMWEDYVASKEWVLEGEDGLKTLYLILRDEAGNFSGRYSERIILDRVGPTNTKVIFNAGQKYILPGGTKMGLEFESEGADKVIISENPDFADGRWEMFIPKKVIEVSEGDGEKTIYVKFRDKALNETEVYSASVILDTNPPEMISFEVNDGNPYTNNTSKIVPLKIEAKDAAEIRIVQKGHAPGNWEEYVTEKQYTLLGEDGEKEIGLYLRDAAGNISKPTVAIVTLDRTPPKPRGMVIDDGKGWTNDKDKKVSLQFEVSGADEMMISSSPNFDDAEWIPYSEKHEGFVLQGEDGEKTIFARFKDATGNISQAISGKVNLKREF